MLCQKCQTKPAIVHITRKVMDSTSRTMRAETEHHLCETCGREFFENNPELKSGPWLRPTLKLQLRAEPTLKPPRS